MFEAVYGPGGTDKIEYIYSCIRENMKNDVFSYILVPEQFSLYMEKDILSKLGVTAQTSVKVFTFSRLCNMVFGEVGPLRMRYIDSAGKLILAKRAMQMLENDLDYLKSNVHQSGFAQVIVDIIGSFKRYGVTSEGIKLVLEKIESQELKRKLIDINLIFEKFQELLEEKNSDADDNLALAYPKISRCKNIVGKLYIHEFRSFTPNEYKAIAELMLKLDVCIALCTDDLNAEAGIFSPVSDTYRDLKLKAKENDIAVKAPVCLTREVKFEKAPALKHLKDNFFAIPPNVYSEKQSEVHICTPRNYYQEVEMTARLILKLCRTEGYRYSDFLILSGNDEKYNKIIPAVFRQNNINVFLDSKRNINSNPIVRMITAMLEILAYGYSYERVMAIAGSGLLPEDISRGEVDVFENYLLATEPSHKMWNEDEWNFNPHMAYDMESINRVRTRLLLPISDAQNSISGTKTFGEICDLVTMWLDDINLVKCIKEKCEYFDKNNFPELSEEYRQVWNAVLTVLAQLKGLMNDEKITYKKFAELFATACGGVEVGMVPQTIDRVIYSDIHRFRSTDTKVVIVLGMIEGVFPQSYGSEGLISENDREELANMGVQISPSMHARMKEEQLIVYNVLTTPSEKLYLSAPKADEEAGGLLASSIIRTISKDIFPNIVPYSPDNENEDLNKIEGADTAFSDLAVQIAKLEEGKELKNPWRDVYVYFKDSELYADKLKKLLDSIKLSRKPKTISPELVKALYGDVLRLSATKIENYNSCAFKYFLQYGLIARERDRASFDARGMGSILHAVLCDYFRGLQNGIADYLSITKEKCVNDVSELVESESKKNGNDLLYENSHYYRYMVMRMKRIATTTAWDITEFYQTSLFKPMGYEIKIGDTPEATIAALKVRDDKGKTIATFNGSIDRADVATIDNRKYVSIVDYKSTNKKMDFVLARAGVQIQPLLYANAVCQDAGGTSVGAMLYMQMTDPLVNFKCEPVEEELSKAIHKNIPVNGWICDKAAEAFVDKWIDEKLDEKKDKPKKATGIGGDVFEEKILDEEVRNVMIEIKKSTKEIINGNIKNEPLKQGAFDACEYCKYKEICEV